MACLYPYRHCSVKPVFFDLVDCQQSLSTVDILFLPQTWTSVKPGPMRLLHLLFRSSLAAVFYTSPSASAALKVYSFGKPRREIVSSVMVELAPLPYMKTMTSGDDRTVAQRISHYYSIISLSCCRVSADYMPMRTAFQLGCVPMTDSLLLSASVSRSSGVSSNFFSNILNTSSTARTAHAYTLFLP